MITPEDLSKLLSGDKGVEALDAARELVAAREELRVLGERCAEFQQRCLMLSEALEQKTLEAQGKSDALTSIRSSLLALVQ